MCERVRALLVRSDHNTDMTMFENPLIRFLRHRQFINRLSSRKDPTVYRLERPAHTPYGRVANHPKVCQTRSCARTVDVALARNGKPS